MLRCVACRFMKRVRMRVAAVRAKCDCVTVCESTERSVREPRPNAVTAAVTVFARDGVTAAVAVTDPA